MKYYGIPTDSINNQFKLWVQHAREVNRDLVIAIKADSQTPYPKIKKIMNTLQDMRENRYNLITVRVDFTTMVDMNMLLITFLCFVHL